MAVRGARRRKEVDSILAVIRSARDVANGTRYDVEIAAVPDRVPAVLLIPFTDAPAPAALLLHGLGSEKERMTNTVGAALLKRGVAALAVDLPMHGEREEAIGMSRDAMRANPLKPVGTWRAAIREARIALEYLEAHSAVDGEQLGIVGY